MPTSLTLCRLLELHIRERVKPTNITFSLEILFASSVSHVFESENFENKHEPRRVDSGETMGSRCRMIYRAFVP